MSTSEKKIVLRTADGETFQVSEAVANQSQTVAHLIEDGCAENGVPLANVSSEVLAKVLEYCEKHVGDGDDDLTEEKKKEIKEWGAEFVKIDHSTIFDLILASNYLNIRSLLDLTCQTIADDIAACKDADAIRLKFQIENDFTPEEEAEVRRENQWAFE